MDTTYVYQDSNITVEKSQQNPIPSFLHYDVTTSCDTAEKPVRQKQENDSCHFVSAFCTDSVKKAKIEVCTVNIRSH